MDGASSPKVTSVNVVEFSGVERATMVRRPLVW